MKTVYIIEKEHNSFSEEEVWSEIEPIGFETKGEAIARATSLGYMTVDETEFEFKKSEAPNGEYAMIHEIQFH